MSVEARSGEGQAQRPAKPVEGSGAGAKKKEKVEMESPWELLHGPTGFRLDAVHGFPRDAVERLAAAVFDRATAEEFISSHV